MYDRKHSRYLHKREFTHSFTDICGYQIKHRTKEGTAFADICLKTFPICRCQSISIHIIF